MNFVTLIPPPRTTLIHSTIIHNRAMFQIISTLASWNMFCYGFPKCFWPFPEHVSHAGQELTILPFHTFACRSCSSGRSIGFFSPSCRSSGSKVQACLKNAMVFRFWTFLTFSTQTSTLLTKNALVIAMIYFSCPFCDLSGFLLKFKDSCHELHSLAC